MKKWKEKLQEFLVSGLLPFYIVGIALLVLGISTTSLTRLADHNQIQTLHQAIVRSAVHCYATEGYYPAELSYLKNNYGITYDQEKYFVSYSAFASNIMPEITVIKR